MQVIEDADFAQTVVQRCCDRGGRTEDVKDDDRVSVGLTRRQMPGKQDDIDI